MKITSPFRTIKAKVLMQFGFIVLVLLLIGALFWSSSQNLQAAQEQSSRASNDKMMLQKAVADHFKWAARLNSTINYGLEFTGSLDATTCDFGKFLYCDELQNGAEWAAFVQEVEPFHNKIHAAAKTILDHTDKAAKETLYVNNIRPTLDELVAVLNVRIDEQSVVIETEEAQEKSAVQLQMTAIVVQVLLLLALLVVFYLFIRREIVSPIVQIERESRRLAEGELSLDFTTKCKNSDIRNLGDSLNLSVSEIKIYIDDIAHAMEKMANRNFNVVPSQRFLGDFAPIETSIGAMIQCMTTVLTKMDDTAEHVSSSSGLIADSAQIIAQGATEQASSVEELSAAATEISSKVRRNAESAEHASTMATDATTAIADCNSQMQRLMGSMHDIDAKSKQIEKIIKTIEDIAFQTNILALNAAVEAARAGVAGKGFAVVADEVRNLAGKSAEAANTTTELIQSSIAAIGTGVRLAQATADNLTSVVTSANETATLIRDINKATGEQSSEISQITQGLDQIANVVQTNSATSEENAAASEELSGQALLLKQLIATFTLFGGAKNL